MTQPPQCLGSLVVSVQMPLQRTWPFGQLQAPALQTVPPPQRMLQPPQLLLSVLVSTQASPQTVWPSAHWVVHIELVQTWPF